MKRVLKLLLALIMLSVQAYGQSGKQLQVVSTGGNYSKNATGSISWTLGEPAIQTLRNNNNILTQGFQQTRWEITGINELGIRNEALEIQIYPNPTSDFVNLKFINKTMERLKAEIYDMEGRKLYSRDITTNDNRIDVSCFESNTLLLNLYSENRKIKTYKIQKLDL